MSFIKSRLRRVEAAARSSRCPECGLPPDGIGRIVHSDQGEGFPANPDERCSHCERPLWFVIEIVGADKGEGVIPIG